MDFLNYKKGKKSDMNYQYKKRYIASALTFTPTSLQR